MKKIKKILIIIQRSNGDVLLSSPLINKLKSKYSDSSIDLLVNDDTLAIAKLLDSINYIFTYSYSWRKKGFVNRIKNEILLVKRILNNYDLAINLTASDRSVLFSILAAKKSISAVDKNSSKSWWKKLFLNHSFIKDTNQHILINNLLPLKFLNIECNTIDFRINVKDNALISIREKFNNLNIKDNFIIFHPSAQYEYKVYPKHLRNELLEKLNTLNIPIIITGAKSEVDLKIKSELPKLDNIYDFIGETNLEEYVALSSLSLAYIGMDTLNMHLASAQNKRIFAIFGPTILSMWSPWSNNTQKFAKVNKLVQSYGKNTIFQANMSCVACGFAGCDDKHGVSECLYNISPQLIFDTISKELK